MVTNDVHYLEQSQSTAHEALLCVRPSPCSTIPRGCGSKTDQFYFKDPALMDKEFGWIPQALKNTVEIAEKCNLKLDFDQIHSVAL